MKPRHLKRRIGAALTAIVLSTTVVGLSVTPAQAAVSCSEATHLPNGDGEVFIEGDVWVQDGPYSICPLLRNLSVGDIFWVHCDFVNDYHNGWVYGRVDGTSSYGWLYLSSKVELVVNDDNGDGQRILDRCS